MKEKNLSGQRNNVIIVFMIFFVMLAVVLGGLNFLSERITRPAYIAINFIPAAAMVLMYVYTKNTKGMRILAGILAAGLSVFMLVNAASNFAYQLVTPSTTTDKYAELLKKDGYPSQKALAHFPERIPKDIYRADFYELPEFFGRDMKVNLKIYVSKEQAADLYEQYQGQSIYTQQGLSRGAKAVQTDSGAAVELPSLGVTVAQGDLDDTYTLFVLNGEHEKYSGGVIISCENGEVIYWGEKKADQIQ